MKKFEDLIIVCLILVCSCRGENKNATQRDPETVVPQVADGYDKPMVSPKGYKLVEELSDEFNEEQLDTEKWRSGGNGGWTGRGARFIDSNVLVANGCMQLKGSVIGNNDELKSLYQDVEKLCVPDKSLHKGNNMDVETWSPADYGYGWVPNWSSKEKYDSIMKKGIKVLGAASVISKKQGGLGYYEARIKASKITMSSAFWLQGNRSIEYDITESYGSYSVVSDNNYITERPYKIQTSVWVNTPDLIGKGGVDPQTKKLPYRVSDKFFVLGIKWEKEKLIVYMDDEEIYSFNLTGVKTKIGGLPIPEEVFLSPQHVIFDKEILWGPDLGWPTKKELLDPKRNTFYVDWVRVWQPVEQND